MFSGMKKALGNDIPVKTQCPVSDYSFAKEIRLAVCDVVHLISLGAL